MPIFISHSSYDNAIYSTLCLALDAAEIERWDTTKMQLGESLPDQLRRAISDCEVCVFVATRRSVDSAWCLAELGAFWGAAKKVLLFMTDSELIEGSLPPQFAGTLRVDNAPALVDAIRSAVEHAHTNRPTHLHTQYFSTCKGVGGEQDWVEFLRSAEENFDALGVAIGAWRRAPGFRDAVVARAQAGCRFRLLFMHAENPLLGGLAYEGRELKTIREAISDSIEFFGSLAQAHPNIKVSQVLVGLPHFSIARADDRSIATQYLSTETWGSGPTWRCSSKAPLHRVLLREFDHLWVTNGGAA